MLRNSLSETHSPGDTIRRGFSLIEITAALVLISLLAAISPRYFTKAASGVVETSTVSGTLQLKLEQARLQAIQTGEPSGIRFDKKRGRVIGFTPIRVNSGRKNATSVRTDVPTDVHVKVKRSAITFDSEGATANGVTIQIESPERQWLIDVVAVTGSVRLREL